MEFLTKLSYKSWDNIFVDDDTDIIFNSALNIYLRSFYSWLTFKKAQSKPSNKDWITTGIKTSCLQKGELILISRNSIDLKLKSL